MSDRVPPQVPANFALDQPAPWEERSDEFPNPPLNPREIGILQRVSQGNGLFRLLDENLNPVYDFGPSEPVEREPVDRLLSLQAIHFQGVLGHRLPLRAHVTAWGKSLLERGF